MLGHDNVNSNRARKNLNSSPHILLARSPFLPVFVNDSVRTDFLIKNSRLFPVFFFKTIIYCSRLKVNKKVVNRDHEKQGAKTFPRIQDCTNPVMIVSYRR